MDKREHFKKDCHFLIETGLFPAKGTAGLSVRGFIHMRWKLDKVMIAVLVAAFFAAQTGAAFTTTIRNFNSSGAQVTRFDTKGNALDAHDGKIAFFNGLYYLYGTSYNCGYQWGTAGAPCCGFKSYSSPDLVHWTDQGPLFNANTTTWQTRCNGSTYGCYRPHVIYNARTQKYVLWINVYDNSVGYRVFTSSDPAGPFAEAPVPTLAINNGAPVAGLNNGDHDLFVDDDGTAYVAVTDWRTGGCICIERLDSTYLTGTGSHVSGITTPGATEAPALFKRHGIYYLTYSDPNCGYCSNAGTSYRTASSPLGTWSAGTKISTNSCAGQPSFVSRIVCATDTALLYGSDLWNNAEKNEALANFYWAPLTFAANGAINQIVCQNTITLNLAVGSSGSQDAIPDLDANSGVDGFLNYWDIGGAIQRSQSFVPSRSGTLTGVAFTSFQHGNPSAPLQIEVHLASSTYLPTGAALSSASIPVDSIGWSPRNIIVSPNITVTSGTRYAIVVKSAATAAGTFGFEYSDAAPYPGGGAAYSSNSGTSFTAETNRSLKFYTAVTGGTSVTMAPVSRELPVTVSAVRSAIRVNVPEAKTFSVKLLDTRGNILTEENGAGKQKCSFASLKPGIYMVVLKVNEYVISRKVVLY